MTDPIQTSAMARQITRKQAIAAVAAIHPDDAIYIVGALLMRFSKVKLDLLIEEVMRK